MEDTSDFRKIYFEEKYIPIQTPLIQPTYIEINSNPHNSNITYYNDVYGNSNSKENTDINEIQNLLNNHDKAQQKEKNEMPNSVVKDESTKLATNDIDIPQPRIVNIVSMVNLGIQLNLKSITLQCPNSEYNPKRINAVVMRINNPKAAALIFNTGMLICLGTKDEEISKQAAKKFAKNIKRLGYQDVKFKKFTLINIVATCDLKFNIDLTKLSEKLGFINNKIQSENGTNILKYSYEPEIFRGLILHMNNPEITLLIFNSGKINFVGAKMKEDIFTAHKKVYPLLLKCKKEQKKKSEKESKKDDNPLEFSYINNS